MNLEHDNGIKAYQTDKKVESDDPKQPNLSLFGLIVLDLLRTQKMSLFLMVLIMLSANEVLVTTQQVRKQLIEKEQLLLERGILESEWRNLVIEENVLADPKRVESRAKKQLGMIYVTPEHETVIVIKSKE